MPVDMTYYNLLGVNADVSDAQLKKAYKKSAMKYHPDRVQGGEEEKKKAEDKFKEISEAYAVLSDKDKRHIYDQVGVKGMNEGAGNSAGGFGGFGDAFSMFSEMFGGGGGPFGSMGGGRRQQSGPAHRPSPDRNEKVTLKLKEAYLGKTLDKTISINVKCSSCDGTGAKSKEDIVNCGGCDGKGQSVNIQRTAFGIMQSVGTCSQCNGKGKSIRQGGECGKCKGKKLTREPKQLKLQIPAGAHTGMRMIVKNMSDWSPDYLYVGDLHLHISVDDSDSDFKVSGVDLVLNKKISLVESLTGVDFGIRHLNDTIISVKHTDIVKCNDSLKLEGCGMPIMPDQRGKHGGRSVGNMIVNFEIIYPTSFNTQQQEIIKKVIPHPTIQQSTNINLDLEKVEKLAQTNSNIKMKKPKITVVSNTGTNNENSDTKPQQHKRKSSGIPSGIPGMPGGIPGMPGGIPGMSGGIPGMPGNMEDIMGNGGVQCAHQ
jgi:DnaJ-class molecular chaperone